MEERVRRLMAQVFQISEDEIPPNASRDDLEVWDSLGHMRLCLAIEDEFDIRLDDQQVVAMTDVATVVGTLQELSAS